MFKTALLCAACIVQVKSYSLVIAVHKAYLQRVHPVLSVREVGRFPGKVSLSVFQRCFKLRFQDSEIIRTSFHPWINENQTISSFEQNLSQACSRSCKSMPRVLAIKSALARLQQTRMHKTIQKTIKISQQSFWTASSLYHKMLFCFTKICKFCKKMPSLQQLTKKMMELTWHRPARFWQPHNRLPLVELSFAKLLYHLLERDSDPSENRLDSLKQKQHKKSNLVLDPFLRNWQCTSCYHYLYKTYM